MSRPTFDMNDALPRCRSDVTADAMGRQKAGQRENCLFCFAVIWCVACRFPMTQARQALPRRSTFALRRTPRIINRQQQPTTLYSKASCFQLLTRRRPHPAGWRSKTDGVSACRVSTAASCASAIPKPHETGANHIAQPCQICPSVYRGRHHASSTECAGLCPERRLRQDDKAGVRQRLRWVASEPAAW